MINEETGVLETPYNLASLSKATGNPMLDLGYQCCDMRPYFKYSNGSKTCYTTVYPLNIVSQVINVYEKTIKNIDGEDYDAMNYIGTTTSANSQTITFNNTVYTYQNQHENIRGFYTNKWAKYKPINTGSEKELTTSTDLTKDDFVKNNCGVEIAKTPVPSSGATNYDDLVESMLDDMNNSRFKWTYAPPKPNGIEWFRFTDFINYNRKAENPFYLDIFNTIGPTNDGIRDIYIETKEATKNITVSLGEYSKDMLPMHNITSECLPLYFKTASALGLVYYGNNRVGYGFVDPYDPDNKDSEDGFLYPLIPGQEVQIPLNIRIGATYNIGAFLINKDDGTSGYYFPVKPLNVRFLNIPDIAIINYRYYSEGKDLIIEATITRNGSNWWWGIHRPNADIIEARTTSNYAPYDDLQFVVYSKKKTSQSWEAEAEDRYTERYIMKAGVRYEWNGCKDEHSQSGITVPKPDTPATSGVDSFTLYFTFVELKDAGFLTTEKNTPGTYDVKIEGNLYVGLEGSNYTTQKLNLGREVFEDPNVGWLDKLDEQ